jgi:deoxycytidylate deaminase
MCSHAIISFIGKVMQASAWGLHVTLMLTMSKAIIDVYYPFMPSDGRLLYVDIDNIYIQKAKKYARQESLDKIMPNASVIVKDGKAVAYGANGSGYHDKYGCERVRRGVNTGQAYDLCEGCHPKNHSEQKAVAKAIAKGLNLKGTELYLWGHWWCCESCWDVMLANGIDTVYLLEGSEILFNREHSDNIIGHQF